MIRILSLIFCLALTTSANAAINFTIDSKEVPKSKILINPIYQESSKEDIQEITSRIKSNLQGTDLFKIIENDASKPIDSKLHLSIRKIPNFEAHRNDGLEMILIIDASFNELNELEVKIRLWDVLDERQVFGKFYSSSKENYKKLANLVSDEVFKAETNEKMGHFDSKITYIAESGSVLKRIKRVVLMDFNGENLRYLTNGKDLVLTPIFSRRKDEILFVRYFNYKPQIYSLDTENRLLRKVGNFRGTTFAPAINPADPNIIAFSVIRNGASNIYQMNLFTNQVNKLTNNTSINTTPSYSPDGEYIVFSSDKSGNEQIYIMNSKGRGIRKVSSGFGSYSKPIFSPDGRFITFTKLRANKFSIGIIDTHSNNEKTLTSGYLVEGAKWSPSGRYIIYSRKDAPYGRRSIPKLYIIDVLTGFEKQLSTPRGEGATDPDWIMN
ncbi:MAG: TolB protein [Lentimonas sp.]|jgi:TolB protein